jgi:hypothetical protein
MNLRATSVLSYAASGLAFLVFAADIPRVCSWESLSDSAMDSVRGTSDLTKTILPNSSCSTLNATKPQVSADDCPGNCVQVGPPLPCILCQDDGLGNITQTVASGGNFLPVQQIACGTEALGGCTFVGNDCLCLNQVPNGTCSFKRSMGAVENQSSPGP